LFSFPNLEIVEVDNNPLKGNIPKEIKLCSKLVKVNLDNDVVTTPRLPTQSSKEESEYSFSEYKGSFAAKNPKEGELVEGINDMEELERKENLMASTLRDLITFEQPFNESTNTIQSSKVISSFEKTTGKSIQSQSVKDLHIKPSKYESELMNLINSIKADYNFNRNDKPVLLFNPLIEGSGCGEGDKTRITKSEAWAY